MGELSFGWLNWTILIAFLLGTTLWGHFFRGDTSQLRGFFLGDRNVPWWAVAASIIASKMSALTFIAVPGYVFKPGGDLAYAQMLIGMVIGNVLMAVLFVKPYYEKEIYSPYEFMGSRLGGGVEQLNNVLFTLGALLSQGVRLLATALVLSVITGLSIYVCILIIGVFSVIWTLIGGISTVIWTDFLQFGIFIIGALFALFWAVGALPVGLTEAYTILDEKGKLALIDISLDPSKTFTLWVGLIAFPVFELSMTAVDQVIAQRLLTCKNEKEAKKAAYAASLAFVFSGLMLLVGLSLVVFYHFHPLDSAAAGMMSAEPDRIFPYFLVSQIPKGISGLIIAAIFAAGITTLDSALAALSQTSVMGFYQRYLRPKSGDGHLMLVTKFSVVTWGVIISLLAIGFHLLQSEGLLELGFQANSYVYGTMMGILILALWNKGNLKSIIIGAICSIGTVLFLQFIGVGIFWWNPAAILVLIGVTLVVWNGQSDRKSHRGPSSTHTEST